MIIINPSPQTLLMSSGEVLTVSMIFAEMLDQVTVFYNCLSCKGDHQDPEDQDGLRFDEQKTAKLSTKCDFYEALPILSWASVNILNFQKL